MTNMADLKFKADTLFWVFENNFFENRGNFPRKTNLVLEFAAFIDQASQNQLENYVSFVSHEEFKQLKKLISQGIDIWLGNGDIKTLLL